VVDGGRGRGHRRRGRLGRRGSRLELGDEKLGNLLAAAGTILARLRSLQAMLPAEMDPFPGSPDTP
jgi:hypothetical protein